MHEVHTGDVMACILAHSEKKMERWVLCIDRLPLPEMILINSSHFEKVLVKRNKLISWPINRYNSLFENHCLLYLANTLPFWLNEPLLNTKYLLNSVFHAQYAMCYSKWIIVFLSVVVSVPILLLISPLFSTLLFIILFLWSKNMIF